MKTIYRFAYSTDCETFGKCVRSWKVVRSVDTYIIYDIKDLCIHIYSLFICVQVSLVGKMY